MFGGLLCGLPYTNLAQNREKKLHYGMSDIEKNGIY